MKLWYSFVKELKLASTSFYFMIEIGMAIVFLLILLFVIPKEVKIQQEEYLYIIDVMREVMVAELLNQDTDKKEEEVIIGKDEIKTTLYENEYSKIYLTDSKEDLASLAEKEKVIGIAVEINEESMPEYTYYLQGYESEKLKNLFLILNSIDEQELEKVNETQEVRKLEEDTKILSNRENVLPSFLVFNGSLMGLFIIASYIFLDKNEGIIKAYAVTASKVWIYLASKIGVILVTTTVTSLIMAVPVMKLDINYFWFILFLLSSGFFASVIGLAVASFYKDMSKAFTVIYALVIVMVLPNIAHFIPSWNPNWIKWLPSYPMLEGFKEIILKGNYNYVFLSSLGFIVAGTVIFIILTKMFKKRLGDN